MRRLLLPLLVVACRSTVEPCPLTQTAGCRWRAEYSDAQGVIQITGEIWYRTCPPDQPKPPYRVIPDSAAVCDRR